MNASILGTIISLGLAQKTKKPPICGDTSMHKKLKNRKKKGEKI